MAETNKQKLTRMILGSCYNMLSPTEFLYDRKGPWPQPSPHHVLGEAAAVLHIPLAEVLYWWMKVGIRYVFMWIFAWPWALLKALRWGGLHPVSDQEYADFFYHTCYAKFFSDILTDEVKEIFKDHIVPGKKYLVADFIGMGTLDAIPGAYTEVSRTLFEQVEGGVKAVAINLRDYVVTPADGDVWELGKYISLQGAGNHIVVGTHSRLHFPVDTVNAITKTSVPMSHPLFKLIIPHTELTLKLDYQVLNSKLSLLQNNWWMIYAPFPATGESMRNLVVIGFSGIPNNPCYPKYSYPLDGPSKVLSPYGTFHEIYYKNYFDFVKEILGDIKSNDEVVRMWANYIHNVIPSFPNGEQIWQGDNLYHAVASYIWDVSLGHAADHKTYAELPLMQNPLRLRQASPLKKTDPFKLNRSKIVTILDQTKLVLANKMFFLPTNVSNMIDIDYNFTEEKHNQAAQRFFAKMKETEKTLPVRNYMPVDEIPTSIQY